MIRNLLLLMLAVTCAQVFAQDNVSLENRRYLNPVIDAIKFTDNIVFAEKHNDLTGREEVLKLRVFEPADDTEQKRPLFLLTPGGGFVVNEDTWMNGFAEEIARSGYVVALNGYRLSDNINTPENYFNALAKAVADQRSALEYLVSNASRFGIDPERIFIGGHSAGAITSMNNAYLDSDDAILPLKRQIFEQQELLVKTEEKPKLLGVINLSGLLANMAIINRQDVPLFSLHGDVDSVVNVHMDENIFGSIAIHQYADIVGTDNELHIIKQALHNDTSIASLCEECIPLIKRFMFNQINQEPKP